LKADGAMTRCCDKHCKLPLEKTAIFPVSPTVVPMPPDGADLCSSLQQFEY